MSTQRMAGIACLLTVFLTAAGLVSGQTSPEAAAPTPAAASPAPEAAPATPAAEPPTSSTEPAPSPAPADPAATDDAESDRGRAPVSAEDILKEFQKERPVAEPLMPKSPVGEIPGRDRADVTAGDSGRLPDGFILVDRTCRLVRDGDWWVVTFVADNHPQTVPEPPKKLLPNRMLERMVRESENSADSIEFIVSGEVTDFMGENYLLLRKLMRKRDLGNLTH